MENKKILSVNLSTQKTDSRPASDELLKKYMGGEGVGTRLIWEMVPARADPFGPDNAIVFASAPLNGTMFPAGARGTVVFKSPETGTISMSNMGGHWGGPAVGVLAKVISGLTAARRIMQQEGVAEPLSDIGIIDGVPV